MQIQYCDSCNSRVDSEEVVTVEGRVYCRTCAAQLPAQSRAGGSGAQKSANAASSGSRRATPGNLVSRRSPASGNALPSGTGRARSAGPAPGASRGRAAAPTPPEEQELSRSNTAARSSNVMVLILMVAGVCLGGAGVVLLVRASPDTQEVKTPSPATTTVVPSVSTPIAKQPDPTSEPSPASDGRDPLTQNFDAREYSAQAHLAELKDLEKKGINPYDLRLRYEKMLSISGISNTAPGKLALAKFKELEPFKQRPPDKSESVASGVEIVMFENHVVDRWKAAFSAKPYATKTLPDINFPDKGRIAMVFDRPEWVAGHITGFIEVPSDGSYTFYVESDDGSIFYIGDTLVVENDGSHKMTEKSGNIQLKAGKHAFHLDYFQGMGDAGLILRWSAAGMNKSIVPAGAFKH